MIKIVALTVAFLLSFMTAGIACDNECKDNDPIRVYACNWTDQEILVHVSKDGKLQHYFVLPKSSTIGNPDLYRGTLAPNCFEMWLSKGQYNAKYKYKDSDEWKFTPFKVCPKMPQPIELDFEP